MTAARGIDLLILLTTFDVVADVAPAELEGLVYLLTTLVNLLGCELGQYQRRGCVVGLLHGLLWLVGLMWGRWGGTRSSARRHFTFHFALPCLRGVSLTLTLFDYDYMSKIFTNPISPRT